jgi:hypothetical protein
MKILFHLLMLSFTASCTLGGSPDERGEYAKQFPTTPLANQVCQMDRDCVVSKYRDGNCCPTACHTRLQTFHQDTYKILRAHQSSICVEGQYTCPLDACPPADTPTEARCIEGYCMLVSPPKAAKLSGGRLGKAAKASKHKAKRNALKYKGGKQQPGKRKVQKRP